MNKKWHYLHTKIIDYWETFVCFKNCWISSYGWALKTKDVLLNTKDGLLKTEDGLLKIEDILLKTKDGPPKKKKLLTHILPNVNTYPPTHTQTSDLDDYYHRLSLKIVVYLIWHKSPNTWLVPLTCTLTLKVADITWCIIQETLQE